MFNPLEAWSRISAALMFSKSSWKVIMGPSWDPKMCFGMICSYVGLALLSYLSVVEVYAGTFWYC